MQKEKLMALFGESEQKRDERKLERRRGRREGRKERGE
jgi:hypothetical protein